MLSSSKKKRSIKSTIEEIKQHDTYFVGGRKSIFNNKQ